MLHGSADDQQCVYVFPPFLSCKFLAILVNARKISNQHVLNHRENAHDLEYMTQRMTKETWTMLN